jgi:hypothetical protein
VDEEQGVINVFCRSGNSASLSRIYTHIPPSGRPDPHRSHD